MKWVRLVKTHCPESKQNSTNNNNNNANVRAVTVPCTTTAKRGFAETLEPVGIAFASPKRAEPACRTSTPQQGAETCPPHPPKGESAINLPEQCFPRRGRKKSLAGKRGRAGRKKHPARNGRRRRARGMGRQGPCSASLLMLLAPPVPSRRHTDSLALSMFSMREDWQ